MTELTIPRLKMLADHLMNGTLIHQNFDFRCFNAGFDPFTGIYDALDVDEKGCGTNGCAIGECPAVFPDHWTFKKVLQTSTPCLVNGFGCVDQDVCYFFGISLGECCHLFFPGSQEPDLYGGIDLSVNATKEMVAENIYAFIRLCEKELAG